MDRSGSVFLTVNPSLLPAESYFFINYDSRTDLVLPHTMGSILSSAKSYCFVSHCSWTDLAHCHILLARFSHRPDPTICQLWLIVRFCTLLPSACSSRQPNPSSLLVIDQDRIWHTFTYIGPDPLVKLIRRRRLNSNHMPNQPFLYDIQQ